ncbi:hypothetical protein HMPREF1550_02166 [Actinomyces sp. oral taxon 877 str. F0543]|nr:hypothetical protein HMPREF1550_02166 [Actinomyces sp. oral taxon 877 str. F0543]
MRGAASRGHPLRPVGSLALGRGAGSGPRRRRWAGTLARERARA